MVADNLERALALEACSAEDMRKGVEMVHTPDGNVPCKIKGNSHRRSG